MVAEAVTELVGSASESMPSSPSSSVASCVGQDPAPVVVALAVTSQPMTRDELVVVQLEESEFMDAHDTQKSVTVDSEHDVGEGEGSGEGSGSGLGGPSGSGSSGS